MGERLSPIGPYRAIIGSRLRSQWQYSTSFALDVVSSVVVGVTELAEVLIVFAVVPGLSGLDFAQQLLVFAITDIAWSLADMWFGHIDELPELIRDGSLSVFFIRPLSVLGQVVTARVALKRIGRTAVAIIVFAVVAGRAAIPWGPTQVGIVLLSITSGAVIFAALFLLAGAAQFWLIDGFDFTSSFTYGSHYVSQFAITLMTSPVRWFFTFLIPAAFVGYVPTLALIGRTGPFGLGAHTVWAIPLSAVGLAGAALLAWGRGVRHFTAAGG